MRAGTLEDVAATVAIVDGRIAMSADGDADLQVDAVDYTPLSAAETHATLRVVGEDYRASIELDADDLAALQDALTEADVATQGEEWDPSADDGASRDAAADDGPRRRDRGGHAGGETPR
jgi:hypothetical protein